MEDRNRITLNYMQKEMVEDRNLKQTTPNTSLSFTQDSKVDGLCGVLFEGKSPLKECLNLDGHSCEAFTCLFARNIFTCLLSANKNFPVDLSE